MPTPSLAVGFVNSVLLDFQGNPEPGVGHLGPQHGIAADKKERLEQARERVARSLGALWMAEHGKACPPRRWLTFSVEHMPQSSRATGSAGRVLPGR
jgi:hypothetical protein